MKECKYCKEQINKKAKVCPICKRKLSHKGRFIFLGILVLFIIAVVSAVANVSNENTDNGKCYATLEEFNKISNGMTYKEAADIIGCEGTVMSESEIMNSKMTIYSWYGKDGISNMNINVSDGKIINKTQIGLK